MVYTVMYCMEYGSLILSYTSYIVHIQFKHQGRIQDLSEWEQDFLGTKKFIIKNKKSRRR